MQTPAVLHMAGVRFNAMQCKEMLTNKMTPAVLYMAAISSITHSPALWPSTRAMDQKTAISAIEEDC